MMLSPYHILQLTTMLYQQTSRPHQLCHLAQTPSMPYVRSGEGNRHHRQHGPFLVLQCFPFYPIMKTDLDLRQMGGERAGWVLSETLKTSFSPKLDILAIFACTALLKIDKMVPFDMDVGILLTFYMAILVSIKSQMWAYSRCLHIVLLTTFRAYINDTTAKIYKLPPPPSIPKIGYQPLKKQSDKTNRTVPEVYSIQAGMSGRKINNLLVSRRKTKTCNSETTIK